MSPVIARRSGSVFIRPRPPTAPDIFLEHQQRCGFSQRFILAIQVALQLLVRLAQLLRLLATPHSGRGAKVTAPLRQIMRK